MSKKKGHSPRVMHVYHQSSVKSGMRNKMEGAQKEMLQHVIEDAKKETIGRASKNKPSLTKKKK